jgi:threonine dehydrogenase-like Zn-dependent dehydrogenase
MRGAVLHAPGDVRFEERAHPTIINPTDAVIRTAATCVCGSDLCGSDLWDSRHQPGRAAKCHNGPISPTSSPSLRAPGPCS